MIKIMKTFKINENIWTIEFLVPEDDRLKLKGSDCAGICWTTHKKIYIDKTLTEKTMRNVIRHELTHAYIYDTQCYQPTKFDQEFLAEFVGIYGEMIILLTDRILKGYNFNK